MSPNSVLNLLPYKRRRIRTHKMFYPNVTLIFIALFLLPQAFVQGGFFRELRRKFTLLFKSSKQRPGPFYDSCNLCSFGPCTPMVLPTNDANFDAYVHAEKIMVALAPSNAYGDLNQEKKDAFPPLLLEISARQRTAVAEAFKKKYNRLIIEELRGRMHEGHRYYTFIESLSLPMPQFFHEQFLFAKKFLGKDQVYREHGLAIILEILITLPKCLMDKVIESYNSIAGKFLTTDLDALLTEIGKPPEYREVVKKLIDQERDTNQHVSWIKALRDAYKLKSSVISERQKEMKEIFSELFIKFSYAQTIETIIVYENLRHGDKEFKSLFDDIDKYTGHEQEVYKFMVRLLKNKPLYYAETFQDIFKSRDISGKFQKRVINLIVGRYDVDLKNIIDAYNQQSKTRFRADFDAWERDDWAASLKPTILKIIDKASTIPA